MFQNISNNQYYRCDPEVQIENVTYHQLTRFDQGYIVNIQNMNDSYSCKGTCQSVTAGRTKKCFSEGNEFFCKGDMRCDKFYDCEFWGTELYACVTDTQPSHRRYEHVDFYHVISSCSGIRYKSKTYLDSFWSCDPCFCYCDDFDHRSDRIISLHKQEANIEANEVITGMRIVKLQQVFYLQIQVGTLLPMLLIDQNSLKWVPLEESEDIMYDIEGPDYYVMSRQTAMEMIVYKFKDDQVLTGIINN